MEEEGQNKTWIYPETDGSRLISLFSRTIYFSSIDKMLYKHGNMLNEKLRWEAGLGQATCNN